MIIYYHDICHGFTDFRFQRELSEREIGARRHQHLSRIEENAVVFQENGRLAFDLLITAPSYVASARWDALPTDEHGFLRTESASRQVENHPNVYAIGDASDHPVKQGYLALLQADAAAEHWAARQLNEKPGFSFESQSSWLMEQLDQALFAQGKLEEDALPFEEHAQVERLPVGQLRRIMASEHLPDRDAGTVNPLYAGLLWKGTEMGLKMLKHLTKRESI